MKQLHDISQDALKQFEAVLGYPYKNKDLLIHALTHSSYANASKNKKLCSNERLEFLGDAVLNIVISQEIYTNYHYLSEGEMTKIRAAVVCERSLEKCSKALGIGNYLLLGKGEELTGGRERTSILSDAFEALIGSIHIDGGLLHAQVFILKNMRHLIEESAEKSLINDYKTFLQEKIQKNSDAKIIYEIIEEQGPDHHKIFKVQVKILDTVYGIGEGKSKKQAEQNAAKAAIEKL